MRRDARVVAFQLIFEKLFSKQPELNTYDEEFMSSLKKTEDIAFAKQILNSYLENSEKIQQLVENSLISYETARVYKTDLALLYSAVAEIQFIKTPPQIVINETLEIAKSFSTEKSVKFLNGVLASIIKGSL